MARSLGSLLLTVVWLFAVRILTEEANETRGFRVVAVLFVSRSLGGLIGNFRYRFFSPSRILYLCELLLLSIFANGFSVDACLSKFSSRSLLLLSFLMLMLLAEEDEVIVSVVGEDETTAAESTTIWSSRWKSIEGGILEMEGFMPSTLRRSKKERLSISSSFYNIFASSSRWKKFKWEKRCKL